MAREQRSFQSQHSTCSILWATKKQSFKIKPLSPQVCTFSECSPPRIAYLAFAE